MRPPLTPAGRAVASMLLASAIALSAIHARAAEDAFVCMEESQEKCDHENRNMALFIEGMDAFERGRASGDLSEARRIGKQLIDRKDERHGKGLLKMVYVQVTLGVHKNFVEAYRWIEADMAAGETYKRLDLNWAREKLAARMTPEQLAEAKR